MKIGECTRERLVLVVDTLGRGSLGMCSEALTTPEKVVVGADRLVMFVDRGVSVGHQGHPS